MRPTHTHLRVVIVVGVTFATIGGSLLPSLALISQVLSILCTAVWLWEDKIAR
jgi:hypothetical protein